MALRQLAMSGELMHCDNDELHSWYHADAFGNHGIYEGIFAKGLKDAQTGYGTCSADPDFDQDAYDDGYKSKPKPAAGGPIPQTPYAIPKDPPKYDGPTIDEDTGGMSLKKAAKELYLDDPRTPMDKDNDPQYGTTTTDGAGGPDDVVPPSGFGGNSTIIGDSIGSLFADLF
jgi:hypothetical protein